MVEQEAEVRVVGRVTPKVMESRASHMPSEVEEAVAPHRVESLHPGAEEPSLVSWFFVTLRDEGEASICPSSMSWMFGRLVTN